MKNQSLTYYLNRRYLLIIGLVVAAFTALISFMNWSGMDDTTEHYMFYEAEVLTEHYQPGQNVAEFDAGRKEYYWGQENLPKRYAKLVEGGQLELDEASLFFEGSQYIYILPFSLPDENSIFYVIHIFAHDEYAKSNQSIRLSLSFLSFLLFVLLIFFITRVNRRVAEQINVFEDWMANISKQSATEYPDAKIPDKVCFSELLGAAERLQNSLQTQYELGQVEKDRVKREKDFLSSLSHELRTPISVIAAAISVHKKRNELSDKDNKVLDKLARANGNMKLMTSTLLQVWRKQKSANKPISLSLAQRVTKSIESSYAYCSSNIRINLEISSRESVVADESLVEIALVNLLRNACQYTSDANIDVSVSKTKIRIKNAYDSDHQYADSNYGFGFGLYLVETICQQQGWPFHVRNENSCFIVEIEVTEPDY